VLPPGQARAESDLFSPKSFRKKGKNGFRIRGSCESCFRRGKPERRAVFSAGNPFEKRERMVSEAEVASESCFRRGKPERRAVFPARDLLEERKRRVSESEVAVSRAPAGASPSGERTFQPEIPLKKGKEWVSKRGSCESCSRRGKPERRAVFRFFPITPLLHLPWYALAHPRGGGATQ
jgi:hypothetical protein